MQSNKSYVNIRMTKFNVSIIKWLHSHSVFSSITHITTRNAYLHCVFTIYNNDYTISNIQLWYKPTNKKTVTYKQLVYMKKRMPTISILLSTSYGILDGNEALNKQIGGIILMTYVR